MNNNLNKGNYQLVLNHTINQFKILNPEVASNLSNSFYDNKNNLIILEFIDHTLEIEYPSGNITTENNESINDVCEKILILRFLINANQIKRQESYITYKEIEGGYVYYNNFYNRTIRGFIDKYGRNINIFKTSMEKIGGQKLALGDISYKVKFINDTYVVFVLWEGDDELEPSGNILFTSNVTDYFNAEDLAVIPDIILNKLK